MYGGERIRVNLSELNDAAWKMERAAVQIRMELLKLGSCVKRSENYWTGAAGEGYRKKYLKDECALRAQAYKFQEYARLLRNMAQMYELREKELAELASALGAVKIRTAD